MNLIIEINRELSYFRTSLFQKHIRWARACQNLITGNRWVFRGLVMGPPPSEAKMGRFELAILEVTQ